MKKENIKVSFLYCWWFSFIFCIDAIFIFDFVGAQDAILEKNGWPIDALQADRANLLSADAWQFFYFYCFNFCNSLVISKKSI